MLQTHKLSEIYGRNVHMIFTHFQGSLILSCTLLTVSHCQLVYFSLGKYGVTAQSYLERETNPVKQINGASTAIAVSSRFLAAPDLHGVKGHFKHPKSLWFDSDLHQFNRCC